MSTKRPRPSAETPGELVFEQIHDVMFLFRSKLQQTLREEPYGIAGMEVKVLGFFSRRPGATQADLVQHSGRDKGQVARLVKTLIERGLLERDPTMSRRSGLILTAEGSVLHQKLQRHRTRLADKHAAALSTKEQSQLAQLMGKLQASLKA